MIIDCHVHAFAPGYFPPEWYDARARDWAGRSPEPRDPASIRDRIEPGMCDADAQFLLTDMAAAGVDRAICVGLDPWPTLAPAANDGRAHLAMQKHIVDHSDGRLIGFAGIDPRRPDALELLRWAVEDLGFRGLKLYPPHGYYPHDDECWPLWQYCEQHRVPVMVHTAVVKYPLRSRFANPLHLQDVQAAFPDVTLILAHAGYPVWWREAAMVCAGHPTSFLDVSDWNHELGRDPGLVRSRLAYWRDAVGAHRMLFASDHFSGPGRQRSGGRLRDWLEFLRSDAGFAADELENFLGGNVQRILDGANVA